MENVLKSKRFVVRKSLIGKNQVITFTTKKGDNVTYNHDKVYEIMKSTLESLHVGLSIRVILRLITYQWCVEVKS